LSRWAASQLSARCTDVVKVHQELPIRIELAHGPEPLHHVIGLDRMNQHALEAAVRSPSSCSMGGMDHFQEQVRNKPDLQHGRVERTAPTSREPKLRLKNLRR
jgi:hypothetical protein